MMKKEDLRVARVGFDWCEKNYDCLLGDYTWNGWECPYFKYETCLEYLNDNYEKVNEFTWVTSGMTIVYIQDEDAFYEILDYAINKLGEKVMIDNEEYYNLGACNWCWECE